MSGEAQIEALLEIINSSARKAIAEYKKYDNEVPTIHSRTYHPIDFETDCIVLKKAVRLLEGACQQLCASLAPPQHTVLNYVMTFECACVRVVVRAKIADTLKQYPSGLHVDELAKLVNLEKGKLARILRFLAIKGCFTEVEPNIFSNNRISLVTVSSSDTGALWRMMAEEGFLGATALYETMTEPEYATSYDPKMAPFFYAIKEKGFKGYFDSLTDTERRENFHRAMIGVKYSMGSFSVLHNYPWNEVKTFCDVGASIGTISMPLLKMHPHLKMINQDLPEVLIQAKDVWAKNAPEALRNNQAEFVPINFLEESPVWGQDVYYLHNIIHDWPDAEAAIIMKNMRIAMGQHSRLLIHGYVLAPACHYSSEKLYGMDVAPEPLLPNFGNGNNTLYQADMEMWVIHNGKERTLDELIALGSAVGLRLEKVYDLAESMVLEFLVAT